MAKLRSRYVQASKPCQPFPPPKRNALSPASVTSGLGAAGKVRGGEVVLPTSNKWRRLGPGEGLKQPRRAPRRETKARLRRRGQNVKGVRSAQGLGYNTYTLVLYLYKPRWRKTLKTTVRDYSHTFWTWIKLVHRGQVTILAYTFLET